MKKISVLIALAGIFLFCLIGATPCVSAGDKTFTGKVIDADTKEPIEGAVVVAVWNTEVNTPTATHTDLKDVKECLTDINGEWSIKGPKGIDNPDPWLFTPYTTEPEFIIFKPGYCPCGPWPIGFSIDSCKGRIKITGVVDKRLGEGGILELPKLTKKEDRLKAERIDIDPTGEIFANKQKAKKIKNFLRLLNEERRFLGLSEYPIWKELENEK